MIFQQFEGLSPPKQRLYNVNSKRTEHHSESVCHITKYVASVMVDIVNLTGSTLT